MVAEHCHSQSKQFERCSLAKISMVAEQQQTQNTAATRCSLAKISMVAEPGYKLGCFHLKL